MAEARQEFPLEQQLRKDIKDAQRARDQLRLDTLRMTLGAIHNLEVARTDRKNAEYGKPLDEILTAPHPISLERPCTFACRVFPGIWLHTSRDHN